MSTEPPSLAARLEKDGPLPWREAARLTARIARALDRLHARGLAHGGIEPLTVLFVGGTVRLADPLPLAERGRAFLDPAVAAGADPDRQSDFVALGRTMAAMLAGDAHAPGDTSGLPPPLAAVQRRLAEPGAGAGYASGNDVAAALELASAASEGFAAAPPPALPPIEPEPPPPVEAAAPAPRADPPAPARKPAARRRRPGLTLGLALLLAVGAVAVYALWPRGEVTIEPPPTAGTQAPAVLDAAPDTQTPEMASPADEPETPAPLTLEEVLAALPDEPLGPPPTRPDTRAQLEALLADVAGRPCSRLEIEPTPAGLRLVGSAHDAADHAALLAAAAGLDDLDRATIGLDAEGTHCRLYDLLAARTRVALPRLTDLHPTRRDYRLAAAEPLIVRVLTPEFPSHVAVDYFTADGMVVHLMAKREVPPGPVEPGTLLKIGDPADGQLLTIAEPFGQELILVVASTAPLFVETRPQIEAADAYLEALAEALAGQDVLPMASVMAIETVPAPD